MTDPHARSAEGPDRLEQAIDRAVADLAQVDPAPGLQRRVASRLAAPAPNRWVRSTGYGLAAAALAALVLIVATPGWNERSDTPRQGAASVTASGDERAGRGPDAPPAVGGQGSPRAEQKAGPLNSLSSPALMAPAREPGASDAATAPAVTPRRRVDRTDDVARRAEGQAVAAVPQVALQDPVSPPSLQRPSERGERERGETMLGAALTADEAPAKALAAPEPADARARLSVRAADVRPPTRLEIRALAVPPLEVEPLQIDPIASTRQP